MTKIEFPKPLKELLEESDLQAPIRGLADRVGEILADNKLPFFPDYTDHGIDHVNCVLNTEVELVPKHIWENSKKNSDPRVLCDADAAVIIGATLLHDIAMHLRPDGFLELVSKDSRFHPLPWFRENHEDHSLDRPWNELWENYIREARRFSTRELTDIIGEKSARLWKFHQLPKNTGQWEKNHCLIIGEFIRRHHARLAHEIAICGFPGLDLGPGEGQFPALGKEEGHALMRLADLIGLTARSHWKSLRVCKNYLESSPDYFGTPRPMGTAVFYPMAVLRVADYLQIDRQRAPAVLLQLRNPQSPISVQEWSKHRAVQSIGPATDPRGKMVTVTKDLSLPLYLQLRELLEGLQVEMDHSTAVLDEIYGNLGGLGLNCLNLATRRVYSNLHSPAFRDSLPYVPNRTGFTADPHLLTLLVEPLYGKRPSVGVRELIQNAVDAVSELDAWCKIHGKDTKSLDLPEQNGDVAIESEKRKNGGWLLRVRDRGIGMTSDTLQNYYFRAGASFRRSSEWSKEFLDEEGKPIVLRSGRFGIGAFAVFLLGPVFRLWTRHVNADKSQGYRIEASANSQLIEIRRFDDLPIGTTVEIEMSEEAVRFLAHKEGRDWYCWDWPRVVQRVKQGKKTEILPQAFSMPIRKGKLPPEWSTIRPEGFDAVDWTFTKFPPLVCNGIRICEPFENGGWFSDHGYEWPTKELQLNQPNISVVDSAANLPLTTQRYGLASETVPFLNELSRDVMLSFIAHSLVYGPRSRLESLSVKNGHPLRVDQFTRFEARWRELDDSDYTPFEMGRCRWCSTSSHVVPADPWLYALLGTKSCFVYGAFEQNACELLSNSRLQKTVSKILEPTDCALLHWHVLLRESHDHNLSEEDIANRSARILAALANKGLPALAPKTRGSRVLVSTIDEQLVQNLWHDAEIPWKKTPGNSGRINMETHRGNLSPSLSLENVMGLIEADIKKMGKSDPRRERRFRKPDVFFVAEIMLQVAKGPPKSSIAKIWKECLGESAIPFDPVARRDLVTVACKHPALCRHIQAWREMKRHGRTEEES